MQPIHLQLVAVTLSDVDSTASWGGDPGGDLGVATFMPVTEKEHTSIAAVRGVQDVIYSAPSAEALMGSMLYGAPPYVGMLYHCVMFTRDEIGTSVDPLTAVTEICPPLTGSVCPDLRS